jgi:hypothetical protein
MSTSSHLFQEASASAVEAQRERSGRAAENFGSLTRRKAVPADKFEDLPILDTDSSEGCGECMAVRYLIGQRGRRIANLYEFERNRGALARTAFHIARVIGEDAPGGPEKPWQRLAGKILEASPSDQEGLGDDFLRQVAIPGPSEHKGEDTRIVRRKEAFESPAPQVLN